jgi:lactoylglutathione lyase
MKVVELNHAAICVSDVEKSCQFYRDVLRLEQIARPAFSFPGAWFRLGANQELHLIGGEKIGGASYTSPAPGRPSGSPQSGTRVTRPSRGNHFALRVDDLEAWRSHLESFGVIVRGPVKRPDGAIQIFVADPDGHLVEVFTGP